MGLCVAVRRMPEAQQRVGGCFLSLMPQMKTLYLAYCANHPSAVSVITEHRCVSWASSRGGGVDSRVWGSLWAARFCQLLLEMRCKHPCVYSRLVSFIILQVSAWGGLMSGFKILISAYNRNGRVLKSPLQPGPFGRRSGGLVGAQEGGRGLVRAARAASAQCMGLGHLGQHWPCCRRWRPSLWGTPSQRLCMSALQLEAAGRPGKQQQGALCVSDQARLVFLGSREDRGA